MNSFKKHFFAGLVIFVPLFLTIYVFRFLFLLVSETLLPVLENQSWIVIHPSFTRLFSFILTVLLIWGMGVVASNFFGKRVVNWFERGLHHIPIFRGLYEALQKITEAFFGQANVYQSAVLIQYPRPGSYVIAFVTSRIAGTVFGSQEPYLSVFVPTVPNPTSGLLLYIKETEAIPLNLPIEDVAKIIVSSGFVPIPASAVGALRKD